MNLITNFATWLAALLLALCMPGMAQAGSSQTTSPVKGSAPLLSAPLSRATGSVDFSGTFKSAAALSTGDKVVMTWLYDDGDGDHDMTPATVLWHYVMPDGQRFIIPSTDISAPVPGSHGTSLITIPAAALGASAISVTVQAQSRTGLPDRGEILTITDTSAGIERLVTPPGPVQAGGNVAGGIFLASENPIAGSGAKDYARTGAHLKVGETYVFRAFEDVNENGIWEAGEADLTATLTHIQWMLKGNNALASGSEPSKTLNQYVIPGATTDTYRVPVNSLSSSGATSGDQGFSLIVEFN
ncbi:SinI family autotransporter-associated protein [Enterobacter hormaechei]|uniref:SinI family autotransporter-associated protein n=1 Tax=Enterobacter hormaechei TaxID=158836 RepID=UPI000750CF92|nr:SinI family autotransporter-associated protein [Enterobacter hormaechei]KUR02950.1 ornithine carbamoyltransferase [Enterobacter hormaechei subsp. xiangfangensis]